MNGVIRCECGFETAGDGDEELAAQATAHARQRHGSDVSADFLRLLMHTRPVTPRGATTPEGRE